jgi:hypothetical protein
VINNPISSTAPTDLGLPLETLEPKTIPIIQSNPGAAASQPPADHDKTIKELSEAGPTTNPPTAPESRGCVRAMLRFISVRFRDACDRVLVLLIALAILAVVKGCAAKFGVPAP